MVTRTFLKIFLYIHLTITLPDLSSSSPALRSLETTLFCVRSGFFHVCTYVTGILHQVAHLNRLSIYNMIVFRRCSILVLSALKCESQLVREVFAASSQLVYTTLGYNSAFKSHHLKLYADSEQNCLCTTFIQDVRLAPDTCQ